MKSDNFFLSQRIPENIFLSTCHTHAHRSSPAHPRQNEIQSPCLSAHGLIESKVWGYIGMTKSKKKIADALPERYYGDFTIHMRWGGPNGGNRGVLRIYTVDGGKKTQKMIFPFDFYCPPKISSVIFEYTILLWIYKLFSITFRFNSILPFHISIIICYIISKYYKLKISQ